MNRYSVFDVETANNQPTSICAIGICIVEDGEIIKKFSSLIKPFPNYYLPFNTQIHGISQADSDDAPMFYEIWTLIKPYFENQIVLAHNVAFDKRCLENTLLHYNLSIPYINYGCTVKLSRAYLPGLVNHKLNTVADHYHIKFKHHDALDDTLSAAQIAINISKEQNITIEDFVNKSHGY